MKARLLLALCLLVTWAICSPAQSQTSKRVTRPPSPMEGARDEALSRAQLWMEPATPIERATLGDNPAGPEAFARDEVVDCRFRPGGIGGSTPKFECELAGGDKIKVKYGQQNQEVYAEVAASRLLSALGFPADRMHVVKSVRCFGCPEDPFKGLQCLNEGTPLDTCFPALDYTTYEDFDYAVIERPIKGRRIETEKDRGWSWEELATIDQAGGGANLAQIDALRLMAVFLSHWDNKARNQRLICLDEPASPAARDDESAEGTPCRHPLGMVQDLGGSFGPFKLDLKGWAATPMWSDFSNCGVSMRTLPYGGSSFPDVRISEEGRRFLASRLGNLSSQQIRELFEGARVIHYPHEDPDQRDVDNWVRAFENKVRAIVDRAPCPS